MLPSHLGTMNDMVTREAKAFDSESMWYTQLSDVYEYFLPQRNLFDQENKGQKKMDRIFDSTSLTAIQQGASKLQESIAPIWARWATFQPSEQVLRALETGDFGVSEQDIRENLESRPISYLIISTDQTSVLSFTKQHLICWLALQPCA
jgi:hypothetical protein